MSKQEKQVMPTPPTVALPKWFLTLSGVIMSLSIPVLIAAAGWATSVNHNLVEINLGLKYLQEDDTKYEGRLIRVENQIDAHLRDPEIHKYELERIKASIQRLTDRVDRLEQNGD